MSATATALAPLVLLHGFTGGPESWRSVVGHLIPPWHTQSILTPCLIGHGEQSEALRVHSFDAEVERLANVCTAHGINHQHRAILVGYSLGARLGLGLLFNFPNLFQSAVLVGVNPGLAGEDARKTRRNDDDNWAQLAEEAGLEAFLTQWEHLPLFDSQQHLPRSVLIEQALIRRRNTAGGLALSLRTCGLGQMPDYVPRLSSLMHPIQLVAGQHDLRFRQIAESMSVRLPYAAIQVVPNVGHNVPLEAPEALAAIIQAIQ